MTKFLIIISFIIVTTEQPVLIVGDSLSAFKFGWQQMLCKERGWDCENISVPGLTTKQLLNGTLDKLSKSKYSKAIIYGGINDVFGYYSTDSAINNIQRIVNACNAHGVKPVVIIGYDPNSIQNTWIKDKSKEAIIRARYGDYQKRLLKIKGCTFVQMAPTTNKEMSDGIHFNQSGHQTFYNWIKKFTL